MHYTTNKIRQLFLDYFKKHDHHIVNSASLIPMYDASLLFINAGMAPLKERFLNNTSDSQYDKLVSIQKCLRVGGKHNDLNNVGFTNSHHTFFEMCGNFSFGAYDRKKAITLAYDFLTQDLAIDKHKLRFSIMEGDTYTRDIWKDVTNLTDNYIFEQKDNFWSMGDIGPCGPCTEIFYCDDKHDLLEIWNIVFMEYNQLISGERVPLERPCIDTGMGLERIASVLQGVHSNYDTDIFNQLKEIVSRYVSIPLEENVKRVISDHIRACIFLIADGVMPSNEKQGYVLRRIIRRAIKFLHTSGYKEAVLYKLIPSFIEILCIPYPYLNNNIKDIEICIKNEEEQFHLLLVNNIASLEKRLKALKASGETCVAADTVFYLYDTHGLPVDFIEDVSNAYGLTIDIEGYNVLMKKQKDTSVQNSSLKGNNFVGNSKFVGYTQLHNITNVIHIYNQEKTEVLNLKTGERGYVILDSTPFYAEAGGQVSDIGAIYHNTNMPFMFEVLDVQKNGNVISHYGIVKIGQLSNKALVCTAVDCQHRNSTARNHTATHLLNAALKQHFGISVKQKGSLVNKEKLRFDFSLNVEITDDDIFSIETLVNNWIFNSLDTHISYMNIEDAIKMNIVMLDTYKYGDNLRILTIGHISTEACSGTHVKNLREIGVFQIIKASSIASGIKRIIAITGDTILDTMRDQNLLVKELIALIKVNSAEHLIDKVKQMLELNSTQDITIRKLEDALFESLKGTMLIKDNKLLYGIFEHTFTEKMLKAKANTLSQEEKDVFIVLIGIEGSSCDLHIATSNKDIHILDIASTLRNQFSFIGGGNKSYIRLRGNRLILNATIDFLKSVFL